MRPVAIVALLVGCGSSWSPPATDAGLPDAGRENDAGIPGHDAGTDLGVERDGGATADASPIDAFVAADGGPLTCADFPERVHGGDFEIRDEPSLRDALGLTAVEGTLTVSLNGVVELPRLRRAEALVLGSESGPLVLDAPCLERLSTLTTAEQVTLRSPPLEVDEAHLFGTTSAPSLERVTRLTGGGQLRLEGVRSVGRAGLRLESLIAPVLMEADGIVIEVFGATPADIELPSLATVVGMVHVETEGVFRAQSLRSADTLGIAASQTDLPSLEEAGVAYFVWPPGHTGGTLDLPLLQFVERLTVSAPEPSRVLAPALTESWDIELMNTTPDMPSLRRVGRLLIYGASHFELPPISVSDAHILEVTSAMPLVLTLEAFNPGDIATLDLGNSRAPALHLLGTSIQDVFINDSAFAEISIPNAPTLNFVSISSSEVSELRLSAPPTAYQIGIVDVVGITQCECEALAPYIIDDGHVSSGGDLRCEGLAPCE